MRILLVDDYAPLMAMAAAALDDDPGHDIDTAADGRAAIEKISSARFDLVVMNIRLREVSGPDCLAVIRKLFPQQKLLILAECVDESTVSALRASGIRPGWVLTGPMDRKTLTTKIGGLLRPPPLNPAN